MTQGHTAGKQQSLDSSPGLSGLMTHVFFSTLISRSFLRLQVDVLPRELSPEEKLRLPQKGLPEAADRSLLRGQHHPAGLWSLSYH